MAGADSTVRVNIVGDAKSLTKATDKASGAFGGMGKTAVKAGAVIGAAFAVDALTDFGATALAEADRVADATGRIEDQLGPLSEQLLATSEDFTHLGQSKQDMLELEASVLDVGTALGIADEQLAPLSIDASETAAALGLITDTDADTWIETLGKAAGGSEKALRALGINLTDAEVEARALATTGKDTADSLTEGELAAAAYELILEKLEPRIKDVTTGQGDFESKTAEVQAKFETLTGKIGEAVEGPLNDLLNFILSGIEGWELFAKWLETNEGKVRELLTPLARLADALGVVIDLFRALNSMSIPSLPPTQNPGGSPRGPAPNFGGGSGPQTVNVHVQGGSPEVVEQAVRNAVRTTARRG